MNYYDYAIYCQCGTLSSSGGYNQPVAFTDTEVLTQAHHNPHCSVPAMGGIVQLGQSEELNVTTYIIEPITQPTA